MKRIALYAFFALFAAIAISSCTLNKTREDDGYPLPDGVQVGWWEYDSVRWTSDTWDFDLTYGLGRPAYIHVMEDPSCSNGFKVLNYIPNNVVMDNYEAPEIGPVRYEKTSGTGKVQYIEFETWEYMEGNTMMMKVNGLGKNKESVATEYIHEFRCTYDRRHDRLDIEGDLRQYVRSGIGFYCRDSKEYMTATRLDGNPDFSIEKTVGE